MEKFDHLIVDARPAIMDADGFWKFHDWLPDTKTVELNTDVQLGVASVIRPMGENKAIITFGRGFHYHVEYVTECHLCGTTLGFDETDADTRSCHPCTPAALDQEWALT